MVTVFRVEAIDDRIAEAVRRLVPQLSAALPLPSREAQIGRASGRERV